MHLSIFIKSFFIFNQPRQCLELDFFLFYATSHQWMRTYFFLFKTAIRSADSMICWSTEQLISFDCLITVQVIYQEESLLKCGKILAFYCCVALFSEYLWSFWLLVKQNQSEDVLWSAFFTISWRFIDWMIVKPVFCSCVLTESNKFRPLLWIWDNWGQVCAPKKVTKQLGKMH